MLPFFLLISVFLLLVFRFLYVGSTPLQCGDGLEMHRVSKGDTCWQIAADGGTTVEELNRVNEGLDCARLVVGKDLCVPLGGNSKGKSEDG